jgi:hypothetical protein
MYIQRWEIIGRSIIVASQGPWIILRDRADVGGDFGLVERLDDA